MNKNPKQGVALIIVMCFIMVLITLVTVAARYVGTQTIISKDQIELESAFYVAEAGAERGSAYVANDGVIPYSFSGKIGNGTYYVTISGKTTAGIGSGTSINGLININPNNSANKFVLTKPNGSTISRNDLTQNFGGYIGSAVSVHVKPNGNGNQNGLSVNGQTYPLQNGTTYDISSSDMKVIIFNDKINKKGKATGHWYISIGATDAKITP